MSKPRSTSFTFPRLETPAEVAKTLKQCTAAAAEIVNQVGVLNVDSDEFFQVQDAVMLGDKSDPLLGEWALELRRHLNAPHLSADAIHKCLKNQEEFNVARDTFTWRVMYLLGLAVGQRIVGGVK